MGNIITISNQKGGVGKTSTATTLAHGLCKKGYHTLLVDTDPQCNASDTYGADLSGEQPSIYDVFTGEVSLEETIQQTAQGILVPGDLRLSAADMQFTKQGREYILKKALETVKDQYDFIIIDTPPALGIITINALTASDLLIVPMVADRYSLQGLNQLSSTIATVREYSNPNLVIDGILLTRFNARTIIGKDIKETIEELAKDWNTKVYRTTIRQSIALPESQTQQDSIFNYAPESTTSEDYIAFLKEFLEGVSTNG